MMGNRSASGSKKPGGDGDKEMLKGRCSKKGEGSGAKERSGGSGAMDLCKTVMRKGPQRRRAGIMVSWGLPGQ